MMKKLPSLLTLMILLVALLAPSAFGLPKDCDVKCTPTTPDWIVCACGWGTQVTTCGQWFDNYCGMLVVEKPSDVGLPNTLLTDLGILPYSR